MNGEDLVFTTANTITPFDFEKAKKMLLADCQKEASCIPTATQVRQSGLKKKKGHTMFDMDENYNATAEKNEYLSSRINEVYFDKHGKLQKQYGLVDDDRPETPKEYVDRIIAGKYVIRDGMADKKCYYPNEQIRWRDPAVKEDKDGFKKAVVILDKARTQTQDIVSVMDGPAERLKALQDFESATIQ